jgi:hypothetical protein
MMVSGSPSASVSLADTAMLTRVSSGVVTASATATGAWLTALTLTVTVAAFESTVPSLAL